MIYAQSIYLIFASVYVCKETVEHFLLASGEGHHHHAGDEVTELYGYAISFMSVISSEITSCTVRIDFPPLLLCTILFSLVISAIGFDNHAKLASSTLASQLPGPLYKTLIGYLFRFSL